MKRRKPPGPEHFPSIPKWPAHERPRERLLRDGADALTEAELLAILIRTGARRRTAVDLARRLLSAFGDLSHLASRTAAELRQQKSELGLGTAKAVAIVAAFELGRRAAAEHGKKKTRVHSPADIARHFIPSMREMKRECFYVVLLDSANNFLGEKKITDGILNSSLVHPREVFRPAIAEPAAAIILVHNHPSGNPEPSAEDLQITRQLVEASKVIGIPIHDHIIIAGDSFTSFAERGIL